tara:strand:- start:7665 stop:8861 length:1197 start_codon:yes stop_codon:yes gene_type:complete
MISRNIALNYEHRAIFTRMAFAPGNDTLRDLIADALEPGQTRAKVVVFVDRGLLHGNQQLVSSIESYFQEHQDVLDLVASPTILPGGESSKNQWSLVEQIWKEIHDGKICRHSYVIAIGGGAVLDLVGFAAATAHRGVRHIRFPTTTLSQGDGGVGVKNGVNFFGKKNWIGAFAVPFAIINDVNFLQSLPKPQRRAGIIEAIKVALIRDRSFFEFIEENAEALANLEEDALEAVIRRSAELHMNHIAKGGDPFELGSARPLDFGHWSAHKLEQISGFRVGHGEAVAIGIGIDLIYARRTGLLGEADCARILDLIERIGFHLYDRDLESHEADQLAILRGLEEFREHLGGRLTITMVTGIGEALEVHEIATEQIPPILEELKSRSSHLAQSVPLPALRG